MLCASHQIPITEDKPDTAFEVGQRLYQFRRIPFGVTNGVASFQRIVDIISGEHLKDTYAYMDNVTVCGKNQVEHDANLDKFLNIARKYNLTFNYAKCVFSAKTIDLLGDTIANGMIKPDPELLLPLRERQPPHDMQSLRHVLGMFAHYSQWITRYSEKIRPLVQCRGFPLPTAAVEAFKRLKDDIANSVVMEIDSTVPFVVETDASDHAIAATLHQS